jgi:hypothetical protein
VDGDALVESRSHALVIATVPAAAHHKRQHIERQHFERQHIERQHFVRNSVAQGKPHVDPLEVRTNNVANNVRTSSERSYSDHPHPPGAGPT